LDAVLQRKFFALIKSKCLPILSNNLTVKPGTHKRQSLKDVRHSGDKNRPLSTKSTELATMSTATSCRIRLCCQNRRQTSDKDDRIGDKVENIGDSRVCRRFVAGFGDCRLCCQCVPGFRHSLEFTMNKVLYKIFGAMSKDSYGEICKYFDIDKVEESIRHRQEKNS